MKRHELELMISQELDGELDAESRAALARATAASPELGELADDLRLIKRLAADAESQQAPALSRQLQDRVDRVYQRRRFQRRRLLAWAAPAAALAAAILAALLFFPAERPGEAFPASPALRRLHETQVAFHTAVAPLEFEALQRIAFLPPEMAHPYAEGWRTLNQAIADHESAAAQNTANPAVYQELSRIYLAKIELLSKILDG